jgi:hypothetical protein
VGVKWRKKYLQRAGIAPDQVVQRGGFQSALSASRPIVERREMDGRAEKRDYKRQLHQCRLRKPAPL